MKRLFSILILLVSCLWINFSYCQNKVYQPIGIVPGIYKANSGVASLKTFCKIEKLAAPDVESAQLFTNFFSGKESLKIRNNGKTYDYDDAIRENIIKEPRMNGIFEMQVEAGGGAIGEVLVEVIKEIVVGATQKGLFDFQKYKYDEIAFEKELVDIIHVSDATLWAFQELDVWKKTSSVYRNRAEYAELRANLIQEELDELSKIFLDLEVRRTRKIYDEAFYKAYKELEESNLCQLNLKEICLNKDNRPDITFEADCKT